MTTQPQDDALRVEAHCTVAVEPAAAFSAFTAGLHTWWPHEYSWGPDTLDRHELEPRAGGRITEHAQDGGQLDWGRVVEWNPPARLVLQWCIGPDRVPCPDTPTRVTIGFHLDGDSTRVAVVHDRFEVHGREGLAYAGAMRSQQGWPYLLEQYAAPMTT